MNRRDVHECETGDPGCLHYDDTGEMVNFPAPLREYRDFVIWPDGVIGPPGASYVDIMTGGCSSAGAVHAAETIFRAHAEADEPCTPLCAHWAIFDSGLRGPEIERIDTCDAFEDDDAAIAAAVAFYDTHATPKGATR